MPSPRAAFALVVVLALAAPAAALATVPALDPPNPVPDAVAGFAIAPLAAFGSVVTAMNFGPDLVPGTRPPVGVDAPDLWAVTLTDELWNVDLAWVAGEPVVLGTTRVLAGLKNPLGVAFRPTTRDVYVSGSVDVGGRVEGLVERLRDADGDGRFEDRKIVVAHLPNGRHNTNHVQFDADGRLWIPNGNPNDDGPTGGSPDVPRLSGAILVADAAAIEASPASLRWTDDEGRAIPFGEIYGHAANADFRSKVRSFAFGFRNVFDVAFRPADGALYTAENGPDARAAEDSVYRVEDGVDYGFPFCYDRDESGVVVNVPSPRYPGADCSPYGLASILIGWHVCPTGIAFPTGEGRFAFPPAYRDALYVAECGPNSVFLNPPPDPGHKVVRVALDAAGRATEVSDFIVGLAQPLDVKFGPDGAMYVADAAVVHRVAYAPR